MQYTPEEFRRLRYCELVLILDGYRRRVKGEREAAKWGRAWLGTVIALSAGAKDVTPAKLLGKPEPGSKGKKVLTREEAALALLGKLGTDAEK